MFNLGPSMGFLRNMGFWNPNAPKLDPSTGGYVSPPPMRIEPIQGDGAPVASRPAMPVARPQVEPRMPQRGSGQYFGNIAMAGMNAMRSNPQVMRPQVEPRRGGLLGGIGDRIQQGIFKNYGSGPSDNTSAAPQRRRMFF